MLSVGRIRSARVRFPPVRCIGRPGADIPAWRLSRRSRLRQSAQPGHGQGGPGLLKDVTDNERG